MKSTNYSEKVLDHFRNPRNQGTLEGDGVAAGIVGNPTCGDIMEVFIKVNDYDVIEDIKFRTFGCGSAIATSSMLTIIAKGKTLDEALKITRKDVADALDGLPPIKMHCSNLAADALHEAIHKYRGESNKSDHKKDARVGRKSADRIDGELEYLGKGVHYLIKDYGEFKDQRILIEHRGDESIELSIELTKYTNRVILSTIEKEIISSDSDLKERLNKSNVKILVEAKILSIAGEGEVEQVRMLNLDEDEEYSLFVDKVILLEMLSVPINCEDE